MNSDEEKIISSLKLGDNNAYKYIFDHYYTLLCSVAYEFLKDSYLAESIVDDVILNMWRKREVITIKISLRAYLVRAVRNSCINYLNAEMQKKEISFSSLDAKYNITDDLSSSIPYPSAKLLEKELEQVILSAIDRLPKECREVFKLSRFEDMKYEQIAAELNISVNTVKYHIKNALSKLSEELGKYLILILFCFFD